VPPRFELVDLELDRLYPWALEGLGVIYLIIQRPHLAPYLATLDGAGSQGRGLRMLQPLRESRPSRQGEVPSCAGNAMRGSHSYLRALGAVALLFLLSACNVTGTDQVGTLTSASGAGSAPVSTGKSTSASNTQLRLAPGDKIRVIVFGEDKLSGEYQIDSAGSVSLPLAGTIEAADLTKPELEQALTHKLKSEYLRNPKVTVEVVSFRPFYVLGEVQKPGEYPYRSGLNVLSAIAIGGGATYRASTSTVLIQRSGTKEMTEYTQSPTVLVLPGDVVRVPERYF
jgi:protein involved in polysaccharide export with SLBB domain